LNYRTGKNKIECNYCNTPRFIFDNGFAPTVDELAELLQTKVDIIEQTLKALTANHFLVLHPNSCDIWVAHPCFS